MESKLKKVESDNRKFGKMRIVTEKEYIVHYYEIDCKRRLLITSLMNYFSDVATQQSENLGVGLDYMKKNNVAWVLYKWYINLKKYPMYNEKIRVRTMPYSFRRFYAYRTFQVLDSNDEIIATANSLWFFIDTKARKSTRITEDMYNAYCIDKSNTRILDIEKINPPKRIDTQESFNIRYTDIDTNQHVNNVKYVDWALETVPLNIINNYILKNINIIYEREATYGKSIKVFTEMTEQQGSIICTHDVQDMEGEKLSRLKTVWDKK